MDEFTDSDVTMLVTDSFCKIIQQIQNLPLNYQLKLTPFSATVSIKKSLKQPLEESSRPFSETGMHPILRGALPIAATLAFLSLRVCVVGHQVS